MHQDSEAVNVVARAGAVTVNLLRTEIGHPRVRAFAQTGTLERIQDHAAHSEIRDQQPAVRAEVKIHRREIAVEKLDAMRVRQRLGELRDPGLHVIRVQTAFPFQRIPERLALERVHRNRHVVSIFHKIVHAQDVWVDELAVPLHFLTQFRHRAPIGHHGGRHKVQRHILAEHFITREPHGAFPRLAQILAEHIAAPDFRPLVESGFGVRGLGRLFVWW